jgi:hypothetical protein
MSPDKNVVLVLGFCYKNRFPPMIACCKQVIPQNAARMFANPAPVLNKPRVRELLADRVRRKGIEIGAGCLRNSLFLQSQGFTITAVDLPGIEARFPKQYHRFRQRGGTVSLGKLPQNGHFDFAVCTFVIETICEPNVRLRVLRHVVNKLASDGFLIFSTRGPADVVTAHASGTKCSDGFVTPQRTFVRPYTRPQLIRLLRSAGFGEIEFLHKPAIKAPELLHGIAFKQPK